MGGEIDVLAALLADAMKVPEAARGCTCIHLGHMGSIPMETHWTSTLYPVSAIPMATQPAL